MANDKVLFIEGFHEIPQVIRGYLENGWTVYNAPRPIMGHKTWQGDFRHGVFYAAVAPEGDPVDEFGDTPEFHKRNRQNDGHVCQIVSKADIMEYGKQVAAKYRVDLAEFEYDDIVSSYWGWVKSGGDVV